MIARRNSHASKISSWIIIAATAFVVGFTLPKMLTSEHSLHHPNAADIMACQDNIMQIWINSSCERHNVIVGLAGGVVAVIVVQLCKRGLRHITCYQVGDGSLKHTEDVMKSKGCHRVYPD